MMCTGVNTVEFADGSQMVTVRLVVLMMQFGSRAKFVVLVPPDVTATLLAALV